jgi:hypothetical protein
MSPLRERRWMKRAIEASPPREDPTGEIVPSDPPDPRKPPSLGPEARRGQFKRFVEWCDDIRKPFLLLGAIIAACTAINVGMTAVKVWLHGIPDGKAIKQAVSDGVEEGVRKAMATQIARIDYLEERMTGLPAKAARLDATSSEHTTALYALKQKDENLQGQLDGFMARDRRGIR